MVAIMTAQEDSFPDELRSLKDIDNEPPDNRQRVEEQKKKLKSCQLYRLDHFIDDYESVVVFAALTFILTKSTRCCFLRDTIYSPY